MTFAFGRYSIGLMPIRYALMRLGVAALADGIQKSFEARRKQERPFNRGISFAWMSGSGQCIDISVACSTPDSRTPKYWTSECQSHFPVKRLSL